MNVTVAFSWFGVYVTVTVEFESVAATGEAATCVWLAV